MQVRIFQARGQIEIELLEAEINEWSHTQRGIKFIETAMCQIADSPSSARVQHYVVSVWYN